MSKCCKSKENVLLLIKTVEDFFFCDASVKEVKDLYLKSISKEKSDEFIAGLINVRCQLKKDLEYFMECDPASDSYDEIVECYPGFKAITYYRIAHLLCELGHRVIARIISEEAHFLTGIDIHPACKIDSPFFIDHGTGIVIGETTEIGHHVRLYQGVTLGALSLKDPTKVRGVKRHPTIGNNVIIYANASILGGDVIIGDNVVIGGNVFLTESIPANHRVSIQNPKLNVIKNG